VLSLEVRAQTITSTKFRLFCFVLASMHLNTVLMSVLSELGKQIHVYEYIGFVHSLLK